MRNYRNGLATVKISYPASKETKNTTEQIEQNRREKERAVHLDSAGSAEQRV